MAEDEATAEPGDDSAFYQLPVSEWSSVDRATIELLAAVWRDLGRAVGALDNATLQGDGYDAEGAREPLKPVALALRLGESASQLFSAVAGSESDLRQVISTMRTALALCWDLYSADETGRVTVREHMEGLRSSILELEAELAELQQG